MSIRVLPLAGPDLARALPDLARLRITVFREWPYLYDGTLDYEETYIQRFAEAQGAMIVAALDGARVVGAATAAPLTSHTPAFAPLFTAAGYDPARIFYFGESVLLPTYRGRGLGHAFFDARERHAGASGAFTETAFCGVVRPDDHPARPADYRPLDGFWTKRGYRKVPGLVGSYTWRDLGASEATAKPMQFWVRPLAAASPDARRST